jgi:putative OPT family oligopeptide transporter
VAAVVCVAAAVAGELLQDFKVGYILGGTPRTIQIAELIAVVVASLLLYFPLWLLHRGYEATGGLGGRDLPAPQAGLMAALAEGIVGGDMPWVLVVMGMLMGATMIMSQVRSPMLFSVGMYLPLHTTFAIFAGGIIRAVTDAVRDRRGFNEAQKVRVENVGILIASGLIAGEGLMGLVVAGIRVGEQVLKRDLMPVLFEQPSYLAGLAVAALLVYVLLWIPLRNAGSPDEPAPPSAIM